jgi:hypothetical protein
VVTTREDEGYVVIPLPAARTAYLVEVGMAEKRRLWIEEYQWAATDWNEGHDAVAVCPECLNQPHLTGCSVLRLIAKERLI